MARSYKRSVVIEALKNVERGADALTELKALIPRMMSERELQVHALVTEHGKQSARDIADALGVSVNAASNILKELNEDEILTRGIAFTELGKEYIYEVKV